MKVNFLVFLLAFPFFVFGQKAKSQSSTSKECAVCVRYDQKGRCKEYDFSNCKPDIIVAKYKKYKDITKSEHNEGALKKIIFSDTANGRLNPGWEVSGKNNGTIILVNAKRKTTAGIVCKGCCSIVTENNTVRCATSAGCTDCGMIVISPLPKTAGSSTKK